MKKQKAKKKIKKAYKKGYNQGWEDGIAYALHHPEIMQVKSTLIDAGKILSEKFSEIGKIINNAGE